jgi:cytochrome P450
MYDRGLQPLALSQLHLSTEPDMVRNLTFSIQTLRWRPVAPGGIPHTLIQDDVYDGYLLPKGTMLFANTWSIHRDATEYDRPDDFVPERFLNNKFGTRSENQNEASDDHRRVTYAFGAGRRICPGQRLAENSLVSPQTLWSHHSWNIAIPESLTRSD